MYVLLLLLSSSHPLYPKFYKIVFSATYDILWFYSNYYVCWLVFFIQRVSKKARRRTSENQTMASLGTKPRLSHNSIIYPRGFIFIPKLSICHPFPLPSLSLSQNFVVVIRICFPTIPSLTRKALSLSYNFIIIIHTLFSKTPSSTPIFHFTRMIMTIMIYNDGPHEILLTILFSRKHFFS